MSGLIVTAARTCHRHCVEVTAEGRWKRPTSSVLRIPGRKAPLLDEWSASCFLGETEKVTGCAPVSDVIDRSIEG